MPNKHFVKNSIGILKEVLLCTPHHIELHPIDVISQKWLDEEPELDRELCLKEHSALKKAYEDNGVKVDIIDPQEHLPSQVYARDFGACIREGVIIGKFKESIRNKETKEYKKKIEEIGIPIVAECTEGVFEGGDFWFLDDHTLAIGIIARTDYTGIRNIGKQLKQYGYSIIPVECDEEYLHLDMVFNIVADKIAVICSEALPDKFIDELNRRGFTLIDVPREGVFKHYCNLQALGNGKVISTKANKIVNAEMKKLGLEVIEVDLSEILKSGGGPHCMTFPLKRI